MKYARWQVARRISGTEIEILPEGFFWQHTAQEAANQANSMMNGRGLFQMLASKDLPWVPVRWHTLNALLELMHARTQSADADAA